MGTVTPAELLRLWTLEQVTVEMVVGHLIQNLVKQQTALETTNLTLYNLRADVDSLIAQSGMKPSVRGKKQSPSPD